MFLTTSTVPGTVVQVVLYLKPGRCHAYAIAKDYNLNEYLPSSVGIVLPSTCSTSFTSSVQVQYHTGINTHGT